MTVLQAVDQAPGGGARDPAVNVTRLDGQNLVYHVVVGADDAIIDGFVIENGFANGMGDDTRGAGMYNGNAAPTVVDCVLSNNSAPDLAIGQGGAVYNLSGATFARCVFAGNSCRMGGAPSYTDCQFLSNSGVGTSFGGAVSNNAVAVTFRNCAFYNNSATYGGAIFSLSAAPVTLVNCAFSANSSGTENGGGYYGNNLCPAAMTNCIFWGNTGGAYPDVFDDSNGSISRYCDIEQSTGANGFADDGSGHTISADPLFVGAGDLRLQAGSPCIDAADGDAAPASDIEGNGRYDNTAVTNTGTGTPDYVDMGAYERQTSP